VIDDRCPDVVDPRQSAEVESQGKREREEIAGRR
jgi:hypothetical protein